MKKTYINPEISIVLLNLQTMIAASVDGFEKTVDDENNIDTDKMLSRRHNVWEDEEEEEEDY